MGCNKVFLGLFLFWLELSVAEWLIELASCDKCNLIRSRSSFIHKNVHWSDNHKNWLFGFLCRPYSIVCPFNKELLCVEETFLFKRMIRGRCLIMTMIDLFVDASVFKHSVRSCHLYLWLMSCKKTGLVAFSSEINKQMITQQLSSSRDHPSLFQVQDVRTSH